MSDAPRKDLSTKAKEGITPDSQKSTLDKATESLTNAGDSIVGSAQPKEQKGLGQQASDATSGNQGKGVVEQAKDAVGLNKK